MPPDSPKGHFGRWAFFWDQKSHILVKIWISRNVAAFSLVIMLRHRSAAIRPHLMHCWSHEMVIWAHFWPNFGSKMRLIWGTTFWPKKNFVNFFQKNIFSLKYLRTYTKEVPSWFWALCDLEWRHTTPIFFHWPKRGQKRLFSKPSSKCQRWPWHAQNNFFWALSS